MQLSKNIWLGGMITDLNELVKLAREGKSIAWNRSGFYKVVPASFIINWPLREILNSSFYHTIRESEIPQIDFEQQ